MKFTEILKKNRELGSQLTGEKYSIAILSNITVFQVKDVLELSLREKGINAEVTMGDYDAIVQDASRFSDANAVLIFWEMANLIDGFQYKASAIPSEDIDRLATRVESEIDMVTRNLSKVPLVLINRFSSMLFDDSVIGESPFKNLSKRLNLFLENIASSRIVMVDLDTVLASVGLSQSMDLRQFQVSKALYSINFFRSYTDGVRPLFMSANGRSKKVLVLDCDNTIWGGILGEDGELGIDIDPLTRKGKIFSEVQTIIKGFKNEGVLLALCSKNNATDVDKILKDHPNMILHEEDFVLKKVNWEDKAKNIREIAEELNLGLDSFIFVDDSPFEIGLIQKQLPGVTCISVPENLSQYPLMISRLRLEFFTLSKSVEDSRKTSMYQEEQKRKELSKQHDSIDEYLKSLGLKLKIYWGNEMPAARAAQLTQKTNQFNLSTHRYTETDIQGMLVNAAYLIAGFEVSDHYGNYGITGLAIIKKDSDSGENAFMDTFLMSCRVIGRNIEYAFFDEVISGLQKTGIKTLSAEYIETHKNSQVEQLYDRLGLEQISAETGGRKYKIDLDNYQPKGITYIEIIE